ncbi:MAG: carboxypeptidase regulatory-like domain-containing protein [Acidobacteria bacterium]|nr:carboxypeptidase regulatory-like domain-containing protein [Acidobacteriota bacterium]
MRVFLAACVLAMIVPVLPAASWQGNPSRCELKGRVRSLTGEPVDQAEVQLYNELWQGKPLRTARSDSRGQFGLAGVPAGKYILRVVKSGLEPVAYKVTVSVGMPPLTVTMKAAEPEPSGDAWSVNSVLRSKGDGKGPGTTAGPRTDAGTGPGSAASRGKVDAPSEFSPGKSASSAGLATVFGKPDTLLTVVEPSGKLSRFVVTGVYSPGRGDRVVFRDLGRARSPATGEPDAGAPASGAGDGAPVIQHSGVTAPAVTARVLDALNPIRSINAGIQEHFHINGPLSMVYAFDFFRGDSVKREVSVNPRFQVLFEPSETPTFRFGAVGGGTGVPKPDAPFSSSLSTFSGGTFPVPPPAAAGTRFASGPDLPSGPMETRRFRAFLDEIATSGRPFVAILKRPGKSDFQFSGPAAARETGPGILRFDLSRQWARALPSSVVYVYDLNSTPAPAPLAEPEAPTEALRRSFFSAFSSAMNARLPEAPSGNAPGSAAFAPREAPSFRPIEPLSTLKAPGDRSFGLFLREATPLNEQNFGQWDSIFDMRMLLAYGVKAWETPSGDLILVYSPREGR